MENKDLEMMDLNEEQRTEEMPQVDWANVHVESEKNSFWQKHKYGVGIATGVGGVLLVLLVVFALFSFSGYVLVLGGGKVESLKDSNILDDQAIDKLNEIYDEIFIRYYEEYDVKDLQEAIYKGMVAGLEDPYSEYYTAEEYKDFMVSTSGVYYGIGAGLSQDLKTMEVTVTKVYSGTPSEEAGLMNGDKILTVNDIDATSMEVSELVQHIRGEEGTVVHIQVYRESTDEILEFDVERRNVVLPSVEEELLDGGIGYFQITGFQEKTAEQFKEKVENLQSQGMVGMIVDVRGNPGGYLHSVNDILDTILPEGLLVYRENKYGMRTEYYADDASYIDMPIVVLMDDNSASASEIFAGAIKDYEYGTLVGTTTFGKGIVQETHILSNGDAIKLTTDKYFTPNGNYIHGVGIEPDIVVEYEYSGPEGQPYDKQYDNQFVKALEVMKEKLSSETNN